MYGQVFPTFSDALLAAQPAAILAAMPQAFASRASGPDGAPDHGALNVSFFSGPGRTGSGQLRQLAATEVGPSGLP